MKKTILFISLVCGMTAFSQTGEAIYSISGTNTINTNSSLVEPFYCEATASTLDSQPYTPIILTGTNETYGNFSLKYRKFKGYEDEPGFANVIQVYRNNTFLFFMKTSNGFADLSSYVDGISGKFLFKKLTNDAYALVFTEWTYASQPPMISIILIYKDNAKLIFNKEMFINSIKLSPFEIELQANTVEYINDNTPANAADLHKIWWDGSVLRYK